VIAVTAVVTLIGLDDTTTPASSHQGFGASTPGGAGGAIIRVTTLADSGPGRLRAALRGGGHRTIVFDVAGEIVLSDYL
jgi:pectate lyase